MANLPEICYLKRLETFPVIATIDRYSQYIIAYIFQVFFQAGVKQTKRTLE